MIKGDVKEIYEFILNDPKIQNVYKEVEKYELANGGWAYHNFDHIKNVEAIAKKVLTDLNYDENSIYEARICCLLHDTGATLGKKDHAERSYIFSEEYFKENNIVFDNMDKVLEAIKNHSDGFDSNDINALTLIFADKLDVKKNRITEEGKKVEGNRQYGHIEDINIDVNDNYLTVNFLTDNELDVKELKEYYFTKKIVNAIKAFSQKISRNYEIRIDNSICNLEYEE